jgi:hypothetical protein
VRIEILADETPTYLIRPEYSIYRKTTVAFLRKFLRMSMELGHLPSLLGRQFFRTHVTSYSTFTFEDIVIFTHDVERCLESLPPRLQAVVSHFVFEEFTQAEVGAMMGVSWRTAARWYAEALDRLSEVFVRHGLMEPIAIAEIPRTCEVAESEDEELRLEESALPPRKPPLSVQALNAGGLQSSKASCG